MTYIIAIIGPLCGVYLGFFITERRLLREKSKYKENLWLELSDIKEEITSVLISLLHEYESPSSKDLVKPHLIDWKYINRLEEKLGADIDFPIRKALKNIKLFEKVATSGLDKRNANARIGQQRQFVLDTQNRQLTARVILETTKLIYVLSKLIETESNYKTHDNLSVKDMMQAVFNINDIKKNALYLDIEDICNSADAK